MQGNEREVSNFKSSNINIETKKYNLSSQEITQHNIQLCRPELHCKTINCYFYLVVYKKKVYSKITLLLMDVSTVQDRLGR